MCFKINLSNEVFPFVLAVFMSRFLSVSELELRTFCLLFWIPFTHLCVYMLFPKITCIKYYIWVDWILISVAYVCYDSLKIAI